MNSVAELLQLTPEQAAAASTTHRRTLVDAAAGSGKTRVILARILHLLRAGADPKKILAFTFTRSACEEIRSRLEVLGGPEAAAVTVTTFHAYCAGVVVGPGRRVATEAESEAAVRSLNEGSMRRPTRGSLGPKQIYRAIVKHESGTGRLDQPERQSILLILARLDAVNLIPMWDLIPQALTWSGTDGFGGHHVLVDEAHDITPHELTLVECLSDDGSTFFVWDPRQAIFGWRGAGAEISVDHTYRLSRSFRFGPHVAHAANRILAGAGYGDILGDHAIASTVDLLFNGETWGLNLALALDLDASRVMILARTNRYCDYIVQRCGQNKAVHVRRDPMGDPFAFEADRFADVCNSGRAVVATIHAAKGREADVVFIAPDETFPDWDQPEERRVAYVAATRARKRLVLGYFNRCETWSVAPQEKRQEAETPW